MVGLAAGGITDVTARLYAEVVAKNIGQRIIIDNRPTAGGAVAAATVQNAAPDGYTLLVFSGSQLATVAALQGAPYDPVKGFRRSRCCLTLPRCWSCRRKVRQIGGRAARARQEEAGRLAVRLTGRRLALAPPRRAHRPCHQHPDAVRPLSWRRADDGRPDHRAGRLWPSRPTPRRVPILDGGKLRALAVDADTRLPATPDVPTLIEVGLARGTHRQLVRSGRAGRDVRARWSRGSMPNSSRRRAIPASSSGWPTAAR